MSAIRCVFIVQGEGRGHLTQALALRALLERSGHGVVYVLVGKSSVREIPGYFREKMGAPIARFDSPNFAMDKRFRAVRPGRTMWNTLRQMRKYAKSLHEIDACIQRHSPTVIINFFEPLGGLYAHLFRPDVPIVCLGHQYLYQHPTYVFPPGHTFQRLFLRTYTRITAARAVRRLALSLYPAPPNRDMVVVPPLLRRPPEVTLNQSAKPFLLVYLLNSGYAEAVVSWHRRHPEVVLHCFWDKRDVPETFAHDETLTFHRLDDDLFASMMAQCSGLVCTAGFEAVAEALYLGKPVLSVPVEGHFEQYCNALDAAAVGAGVFSHAFEIERLLPFLDTQSPPSEAFREWVASADATFIREIEAVVEVHRGASRLLEAA